LDRILAEPDCRDFVVRALRALDARDYVRLANCFALDGVWDRMGKHHVGRDAVLGALESRPADLETQHLISNMVADLNGDSAEVHYTLSAYAQQGSAPMHLHAIFSATDRLIRLEQGWRFTYRTVEPAFSTPA
jgi:ketosteroid isomerase-like protein